jgi:hypothetical protein
MERLRQLPNRCIRGRKAHGLIDVRAMPVQNPRRLQAAYGSGCVASNRRLAAIARPDFASAKCTE